MGTLNVDADAAKKQSDVIRWLNSLFLDLNMPVESSKEELRAWLLDGTVLCGVLSRISPSFSVSPRDSSNSSDKQLINIKKFISVMEEMGLPSFRVADLEQGSISGVVECLLSLRDHLNSKVMEDCAANYDEPVIQLRKRWNLPEESSFAFHYAGHNFPEACQLGQGHVSDLSSAKIIEVLKSNSLDSAPAQSLLIIINGILDESIERRNGEIPQRVAHLLRRVVQEIQHRIATQMEHIKSQNNLFKAQEGKYSSRIRVLEELTKGAHEENKIIMQQLLLTKAEKFKIEERKSICEQDIIRLSNEKEDMKNVIAELKRESETTHKMYSHCIQELEDKAKENKAHLDEKTKEVEFLLEDSKNKIKELEEASKAKFKKWLDKENKVKNFIHAQLQAMQDLKESSNSVKEDIIYSQVNYQEEMTNLGLRLKGLADAADNYHNVLAENQRLYNEVQELKGNIRVYCRIRPFLPGQNMKSTTIDYFGENGELLIGNPFKHGKDGHRMFKFNKVFGPAASQAEIFSDIQPLIRSVLDGYNVCIFAYGQTGSGKTYTMSGPNSASVEDWGVNYRALNDLFEISERRRNSYLYEIGVQMVEIYNEQVRDLLSDDGPQKRLGIWSTTQPNGLAVPDASMHSVNSTSDVLQLMHIGQTNRAVGSTALNERSSRSHSILTVHVRGVDLKTGSTSRGCLHLIDLAGSERVERSEATGDRLKEAQHINKSLSALGDVIFALAQKNTHVPYRNCKLTQVLQSSLGGQAKTLMFVQINPDNESYSETISTLKFAERVSGVELGAARSNKDGRDVKDLLEQVAFLKDTILKKDEEIERLQMVVDHKTRSHVARDEKYSVLKHSASSTFIPSLGGTSTTDAHLRDSMTVFRDNVASHFEDHCHCTTNGGDKVQNLQSGADPLGFRDASLEDRLSDISDSARSVGRESDDSVSCSTDFALFPYSSKPEEMTTGRMPRVESRLYRTAGKTGQSVSNKAKLKEPSKSEGTRKATGNSSLVRSSMKATKPRQ
ncbi:kinesin-like protein KIN-14C isoform X1 [Zingiber officinale]|uniref:kinesin-like protein KIN-14C isoform X1 n=1 Tax=Zingiber officinale TaxID=94328 RepID=UPI001C4B43B5|nr:kinesin-like protein KIN-14C isoform X1 [Zingiber officinale]